MCLVTPTGIILVIGPSCKIGFCLGWVCENHPNRVWDEEKGCQCGAGMPCECQRANGLEQPDTSKIISDKTSHQEFAYADLRDSDSFFENGIESDAER